MNDLIKIGYETIVIEDGVLGFGHITLIPPDENHKIYEIRERYLSSQSSAHTIRRTRKISQRLEREIEKLKYY